MTDNVVLQLSESLEGLITEQMGNELIVAQKKWSVNLTDEQVSTVLRRSIEQLEKKVNLFTSNEWKFCDKDLHLSFKDLTKARSSNGPSDDIKGESYSTSTRSLTRINSGWVITEEPDQGTPFNELSELMEDQIRTWAKTAVFYGVASYRETPL